MLVYQRNHMPGASAEKLDQKDTNVPKMRSVPIKASIGCDKSILKIQRDRNDRCVHIFFNSYPTAPERQQVADARDLTFRENADEVPGADGIAGASQRLNHCARMLFGGNRNHAKNAREWLDMRPVVMVFE
jgi:hypothetical protein